VIGDIVIVRADTVDLYKIALGCPETHDKIANMVQELAEMHTNLECQLDILDSEMRLAKSLKANVAELLAGKERDLKRKALTYSFGGCNDNRRKILSAGFCHVTRICSTVLIPYTTSVS